MSTKTLRKRIALTVVAALATGVLSVTPANAHNTIVAAAVLGTATNGNPMTLNLTQATMVTATVLANDGIAAPAFGTTGSGSVVYTAARSVGLLSKDSSSGTAQTATVTPGATLSFYASTGSAMAHTAGSATDVAFTATGGTFNTTSATGYGHYGSISGYYQNQTRNVAVFDMNAGTVVAQLWTAPTEVGSYVVSYYAGVPTSDTIIAAPTQGTLSGRITVTVVATSAGGSYDASKSFCQISSLNATGATSNVDSSETVSNGGTWYVRFALKDAYNNALDTGNIVANATNGGFLSYSNAGATSNAGTASTVVAFDSGSSDAILVTQPTAGVPLTTTVTVTYNGTTICTKTVTIRGTVSKIVVSDVATQDLGSGTASSTWLDDSTGRSGMFRVLATDSAGNIVATDGIGTFSSKSSSLAGQTIVTAFSVNNSATSNSSTAAARFSTGNYTCGATAGQLSSAVLSYVVAATGTTIDSAPFALRCADDPYTYTASWDKAAYSQGEIATLTVAFLDSKGNPANNVGSTGTWTSLTPMLTAVSATGSAPTLSDKGVKTYTYGVGTASGMTAGSYVSIIDFTALTAVAATKQTPSYKVSTGGDTTSNADVLKSIVALIASINKQIQALQKLILKR